MYEVQAETTILLEEDNMLLLPSHDWYLYFYPHPPSNKSTFIRRTPPEILWLHFSKFSLLTHVIWYVRLYFIFVFLSLPLLPSNPISQAGVNLKVLTTLCDGDSEVKLRCLASAMGVTRRPRTSCLMGSTSLSSTTWRWVEPVTLETKTQLNFNKVKV